MSSTQTINVTSKSTPAPFLPKLTTDALQQHHFQRSYPVTMQTAAPPFSSHFPSQLPGVPQYPLPHMYTPFPPGSYQDARAPPPSTLPLGALTAGTATKRLAPAAPHPAESPAKKKQSKWTADEDAEIIRLRGNGMKWEDISKQLPGRSAISCRLRFQNYLERRSEWDEEKKNKLARLYERFKKDMWEKIAKEMQLPWRAAEAMHWQIGEIEMAQRANVPVFHLAGQQQQQQQQHHFNHQHANAGALNHHPHSGGSSVSERADSVSPSSAPHILTYPTNMHQLPQLPMVHSQPVSPVDTRLGLSRIGSPPPLLNGSIGNVPSALGRRRADSARSVPTMSSGGGVRGPLLPPLGPLPTPDAARITLPPVVTSPGSASRA